MKFKIFGFLAGLLVVSGAFFVPEAAALEHVRSDGLVTRSAVPIPEGMDEVEISMAYYKAHSGQRGLYTGGWGRNDRGGSYRMYEWQVDYTMAIAPDMDFSLSTGWVDMRDRLVGESGRGMDDLRIALRRRLTDNLSIGDIENISLSVMPGLTIPIGRESSLDNGVFERFGPGQNYWTADLRILASHEVEGMLTVNADIGYSLPFGETRQGWVREFGEHTRHPLASDNPAADDAERSERGIADGHLSVIATEGAFRPMLELSYAHRFIRHGDFDSGSDMLHATLGSLITLDDQSRIKVGYQHPIGGRNATRTYRFLLSAAHIF